MKADVNFLRLALVAGSLVSAFSQRAEAWSGSLNRFGFGTATVRVWCAPNAPPNPPNYVASSTGLFPTVNLGPGLAGCDPNTAVFLRALDSGSPWNWIQGSVALGGDTVDAPELLDVVTPTSNNAGGRLIVSGSVTSPNSADFTISWSGSDPGVGARLAWYEGATLLHEIIQIGPWSETITVSITSKGPIDDVELRPDGVVVTLP